MTQLSYREGNTLKRHAHHYSSIHMNSTGGINTHTHTHTNDSLKTNWGSQCHILREGEKYPALTGGQMDPPICCVPACQRTTGHQTSCTWEQRSFASLWEDQTTFIIWQLSDWEINCRKMYLMLFLFQVIERPLAAVLGNGMLTWRHHGMYHYVKNRVN